LKSVENARISQVRVSIPDGGSDGNFFSSPPRPDRLWGSPSLLSSWYRGLSLVRRPEREAENSYPFSAEVKNAWSYTSTLSSFGVAKGTSSWRGAQLKQRDSFTFTFIPYTVTVTLFHFRDCSLQNVLLIKIIIYFINNYIHTYSDSHFLCSIQLSVVIGFSFPNTL